jgi:hypothetical protein
MVWSGEGALNCALFPYPLLPPIRTVPMSLSYTTPHPLGLLLTAPARATRDETPCRHEAGAEQEENTHPSQTLHVG